MKRTRIYMASEIMVMMLAGSLLTFCSGGRPATAGVSVNEAVKDAEEPGKDDPDEKYQDEKNHSMPLISRKFSGLLTYIIPCNRQNSTIEQV